MVVRADGLGSSPPRRPRWCWRRLAPYQQVRARGGNLRVQVRSEPQPQHPHPGQHPPSLLAQLAETHRPVWHSPQLLAQTAGKCRTTHLGYLQDEGLAPPDPTWRANDYLPLREWLAPSPPQASSPRRRALARPPPPSAAPYHPFCRRTNPPACRATGPTHTRTLSTPNPTPAGWGHARRRPPAVEQASA